MLDHVNEFFYKKALDEFQELGLPDDPNNSLFDALEHFVVQFILPKQDTPYSNKSART